MSEDTQHGVDLAEHPPVVTEEERLLAENQKRLKERPPEADIDIEGVIREMERIRADMRDADHDERPALLMQYERLGHLLEAQGRSVSVEGVRPDKPYFAHMSLREDGAERDVFLGTATRLDHGLRIVDWRHAPVSKLFYRYAEGDEYDEFFGGREVSGQVVARRTLGINKGQLLRVQTPSALFVKEDDSWTELSGGAPRLQGGEGKAAWVFHDSAAMQKGGQRLGSGQSYRLDKHLPEISALIDPDQWAVISDESSQLVVVRGVAGSGKTTVALHRLAYLNYQSRARYRADRMMVIVWADALRRFISKVLPALGVMGTPVQTFSHWAFSVRRRLFPFLPDAQSSDTPAIVTRLKLHPVMLRVLDEYVRTDQARGTASQVVDDWMHVVTAGPLLRQAFDRWAPGAFSDRELERAMRWTAHQVDLVTEHLHPESGPQHEDADAADEFHAEAFLDAEDDALLLRLYQLRVGPLPARGRSGKPLRYSHLVVDEVQDLSPLEVRVLMDCTDSNRSVTLSGDTQQHVLQEAGFTDWEEFFGHLGVSGTAVNTLRVAYRSTQPIVEFSRHILGDLAEDEPPQVIRDGLPVEILPFDSPGESLAFLADSLRELTAAEPTASVALLARYPGGATEVYQGLERAGLDRVRLVLDHDFGFAPGIEVSEIAQAKGLEFDYVILLDVSSVNYPDTASARRLLHVGATRAAHQLWVTVVGPPSPLLRASSAASPQSGTR